MDKWQNCWRKIMLKINNIKMQIKSTKNDLKNKLEKLLKNEIKEIKILKKCE